MLKEINIVLKGVYSRINFFFLNNEAAFLSFFFLNLGKPLIFIYLFIFIFIFGCVGSSPLCEGFLQLRQAGATLHRGARASHYRGLSCCGAQAPDAQAQQLWLTGLAALRHVGSSQTRARTRVPCISRQTPNHCATREARINILKPENKVNKFSNFCCIDIARFS